MTQNAIFVRRPFVCIYDVGPIIIRATVNTLDYRLRHQQCVCIHIYQEKCDVCFTLEVRNGAG